MHKGSSTLVQQLVELSYDIIYDGLCSSCPCTHCWAIKNIEWKRELQIHYDVILNTCLGRASGAALHGSHPFLCNWDLAAASPQFVSLANEIWCWRCFQLRLSAPWSRLDALNSALLSARPTAPSSWFGRVCMLFTLKVFRKSFATGWLWMSILASYNSTNRIM